MAICRIAKNLFDNWHHHVTYSPAQASQSWMERVWSLLWSPVTEGMQSQVWVPSANLSSQAM